MLCRVGGLTALLWFSICLFVQAQRTDSTLLAGKISLDVLGGFVWAHNKSVEHLAVSHPIGIMARYSPVRWSNFESSRYWSGARFGMATGYVSSGQPKVLGSWLPVMVSFENQSNGRLWMLYRISAGLAYLTKTYQPEANAYNNALGGPIAWSLQGQLLFGYRFTAWELQVGISILHISNGAYRLPNAGINVPNLLLGVAYRMPAASNGRSIAKDTSTRTIARRNLYARRHNTSFSLGGGLKTVSLPPAPLLPSITASASHWYRYGNRGAFTITGEATWNKGLLREAESLGLASKTPFLVGALAGHEWLFNRISLATQLGFSLVQPYPTVLPRLYQRYGVRFGLGNRVVPSFMFRSHYGKADAVEFGLSWFVK